MNIQSALRRRAREARSWLFDACFPLWSREGVYGNIFTETLSLEHVVLESETSRVRVQARQTYAFARAVDLGWQPDDARELTELGLSSLRTQCQRPDGLFGRRIFTDGRGLADDTADLYDTAFALLAFATAGGRDDLIKLPKCIEAELKDPGGGYKEAIPPNRFRLQNPHMHLFEAFLATIPISGQNEHRHKAAELQSICLERFIDSKTGTLGERFNKDWSVPEGSSGEVIEPGHHFEWVWLLDQYATLTGSARPLAAERLYDFALSSLDAKGRAVQEVKRDGSIHDGSRRTWPQTEALKAHLTVWRSGNEQAGQRAVQSFDILMDEYLTPEGGWIDHYSASGQVLATNIPASTLYHILAAFAFLMETAEA
ncbi:MAG: AGE family epimerase/isomerase [Pseudomonadota bacterium]